MVIRSIQEVNMIRRRKLFELWAFHVNIVEDLEVSVHKGQISSARDYSEKGKYKTEGSAVIIVFAVLSKRKESIVLSVFGFRHKSITL